MSNYAAGEQFGLDRYWFCTSGGTFIPGPAVLDVVDSLSLTLSSGHA